MISPGSSVSVAIPVKNGAARLKACLDGIMAQTIVPNEIVVVDSGSTDGTQEIARQCPLVRLIEIPPESFNHGETRNLAVRETTGDFVVLTVQDARAASATWIAELLAGVIDDDVSGVCGTQVVPHDADTNPVQWYRPHTTPAMVRFQFATADEFLALDPLKKRHICGWDNVTALYRRSAILSQPFATTSFGEDMLWARDAMIAGRAIVYNPAARVFHHHHEDANFAFRRALSSLHLRYVAVGYLPDESPIMPEMMDAGARLIRESSIGWPQRLYWLKYNWEMHQAHRRASKIFRQAVLRGESTADLLRAANCDVPFVASTPTSRSVSVAKARNC